MAEVHPGHAIGGTQSPHGLGGSGGPADVLGLGGIGGGGGAGAGGGVAGGGGGGYGGAHVRSGVRCHRSVSRHGDQMCLRVCFVCLCIVIVVQHTDLEHGGGGVREDDAARGRSRERSFRIRAAIMAAILVLYSCSFLLVLATSATARYPNNVMLASLGETAALRLLWPCAVCVYITIISVGTPLLVHT